MTLDEFERLVRPCLTKQPHDDDERDCRYCDSFCCNCELCDCCIRVNPTTTIQNLAAVLAPFFLKELK